MKYVVVTGGVMSGLGKGITAASIGRLLKNMGYKVTAIKIDPYINIDAGTMSPYQHGEVFVLKDGSEVDLDLGNYERFLDVALTHDHNITTGKVYRSVIEKERKGEYLGQTVQIIPHVTNEIKDRIRAVARASGAEICMVEVGGTVGDIESMPFLEAVRQMHREEQDKDFLFVHVTLATVDAQGEQKTKPTQHSVKELRSLGLQPDVIVVRSPKPLRRETKKKISLFCDVPIRAVVSAHDAPDIYYVPGQMEREGLVKYLVEKLELTPRESSGEWEDFMAGMDNRERRVKVAIVGKYTHLGDSYISIREALKHAGVACGCWVDIIWTDAEKLDMQQLGQCQGILVPGGFGVRGTEGKIQAISYARENNIPYLGLCLGMQLAVVEFTRNVLELRDANSSELTETAHPVIDLLPEQEGIEEKGGTMRLGNCESKITPGSLAHKIYGRTTITERHRHRYEVNPDYIEEIEKHGMKFTGKCGSRMEILEIPDHKFFLASQFHPEFTSRPGSPSPLFLAFIKTMLGVR